MTRIVHSPGNESWRTMGHILAEDYDWAWNAPLKEVVSLLATLPLGNATYSGMGPREKRETLNAIIEVRNSEILTSLTKELVNQGERAGAQNELLGKLTKWLLWLTVVMAVLVFAQIIILVVQLRN